MSYEYVDDRPDWDEFFIAIAAIYSSRGSCDRLRTACVFVKNKRIVGAGYNGSVSGLETCDEVGHLMIEGHCMRTLHGEENAEANAISGLDGATAYVIATPCPKCVKMMLQRGISEIKYVGEYHNGSGKDLIFDFCSEKKVPLVQMLSKPETIADIFNQKIFKKLSGNGGIFKELKNLELIWDKKLKEGIHIIFEGGEKAGKSTQIERLTGYLLARNHNVFSTKEPGGGMPDLRRRIMELDQNDPLLAEKELALFTEDRQLHYVNKIIPALATRGVVLSDRGYPATLAYQGHARGVNLGTIRVANWKATFQREADLIIFMDIDPEVAMKRITSEDKINRFEGERMEFHNRVRNGYWAEVRLDPARWLVIDASKSRDEITKRIILEVKSRFDL